MNKRYVRKNHQYRRNALTAALAVSLGFTGMAYGQSTSGSIFGTAPAAAGESVKVVSASGVTREVPVDSSGHYALNELAIGSYTVSLLNGGQVVSTQNNIQVQAGSGTAVIFNAASSTEAKDLNAVNVVGNALPAIDVTSVNASTTITSKDLQRLPLQHSAESIALLAPGTTPGSGYFGSAVSFGGSSVSENAYYVNGYNTGEPYRNIGGFALPYGAIDQQQTITNGYSAKYGRSDGGVINQLGKSGTNEWHFGGQIAWQPKFAAADPKNTHYPNITVPSGYSLDTGSSVGGSLYQYRNENKGWETIYSAYFGGPLIKDKLFLFVAAEKTKDGVSNVEAAANNQSERYNNENTKYYAKLDWNITDDHHLAFTYLQNNENDYVNGSYYDYDSTTRTQGAYKGDMDTDKDGSKFYIAQYTGYFGDNASLNVLWGKGKFADPVIYANSSTDPYISGLANCGAACSNVSTTQTTAYHYAEDASNSTHALRVDFTYHLGDHALSAGIDNMHYGAHDQGQNTSGPGYRWIYKSPTVVEKFTYDVQTSMTMNQKAYYAQDDWQVAQDWLVSLGIRNDHFTNYNNVGKAFVNEKNQWEPRLGASWDVFGDSSFKVYANAGRYYLSLPDNAAERAANASSYLAQYYTYSGVSANGIPQNLVGTDAYTGTLDPYSADGEYGSAKNVKEVTAKNLKPEYMDEFLLGFDKKLGDKWVYGAMASYRDLKQAIDDECSPSQIAKKMATMGLDPDDYSDSLYGASYCRLINPGKTNKLVVYANDGSGSVIVPMSKSDWGYEDGVLRKIFSVNMYLEHPFDGKWTGRIDYTFSNGHGNTEGQVRSDFGQADVSKTEDWDAWQLMEGQNGELINNRKHSIRIHGAYQITPEWLVSGSSLIQSGMPEECLGYYGTDEADPTNYGSSYHWCDGKIVKPGYKHTPWTHKVDLGVHYAPAFADHKLSFNLDIFNVFNEQKALQTDPTYESLEYTISSTYGMGVYYEQPRYVRLSVNYDY